MKYLQQYVPYNFRVFMAVIFSDFNLRGSETEIFFTLTAKFRSSGQLSFYTD